MKTRNLILIFVISFLIVVSIVNAEACCLKTKGGQYCVNEKDGATQADCSDGSWISESCSVRSECTTRGCCFVDNECRDSEVQLKCTSNDGRFVEGDGRCIDAMDECKLVCCEKNIGSDVSYVWGMTTAQCEKEGRKVKDAIPDETECKAQNYGVKGTQVCCAASDGKCTIVINDEKCSDMEGGGTPAPLGFPCSQFEKCNPKCEAKYHTGPGDSKNPEEANKVYWYDSCGNKEDIVKETDPIEAFNKIGLKPFNGDCDADPSKVLSVGGTKGQYACADLVCKNVWDNPRTDENHDGVLNNDNFFEFGAEKRDFRYNGESWCEYMQAKVGPGLDLPGTRHYLHRCDQGNETVDTDGEGRNKICIESIVKKTVTKSDGSSQTYVMTKANWITNDPESCLKCNSEYGSGILAKDTSDCCYANKACAFIQKKSFYDESFSINVPQDALSKLDSDKEKYADGG